MASEIIGAQVTIGTTAGGTLIIAADPHRKELVIRNDGAANLHIGKTGLTATTAFDTIAPGARAVFNCDGGSNAPKEAWYGLSASGNLTVNVGEVVSF